jgi:hypothetical protein
MCVPCENQKDAGGFVVERPAAAQSRIRWSARRGVPSELEASGGRRRARASRDQAVAGRVE